jgi:vacuolar-type H+-ATPase subunit H
MGENGLNEKRIQQVLEIEKEAQAIHDKALAEAEQLPVQAEQEALAMVERARADAQAEAREMIAKAQAQDEVAAILADATAKIQRIDVSAQAHMSRAVNYVLNRVVGKE